MCSYTYVAWSHKLSPPYCMFYYFTMFSSIWVRGKENYFETTFAHEIWDEHDDELFQK